MLSQKQKGVLSLSIQVLSVCLGSNHKGALGMKNDSCALLETLQTTKGNEWLREGSQVQRKTLPPAALNHGCHEQDAGIAGGHRRLGSKPGGTEVPGAIQDYSSS